MHQNTGHGPEHRSNAVSAAIVDGAAQLQRHIGTWRDGQNHGRQRKSQDNGQVRNEGGHGVFSLEAAKCWTGIALSARAEQASTQRQLETALDRLQGHIGLDALHAPPYPVGIVTSKKRANS